MQSRSYHILSILLCAAAVFCAALLVRRAPASFSGCTAEVREAYTTEEGKPYLTDMDSYYHVRLVNQYLESGSLGDAVTEDGRPWDTRSLYPEGRSAQYQPVIVWITAWLHRLTGRTAGEIEYWLPVLFSAFSALTAFLLGWRMGGRIGGLAAGILVSCAPLYASRTCCGRFDTDMFVVLMELLLILCVTELLRSSAWRTGITFAVLFAVCSTVYCLCWTPTYGFFFVMLTLAGGLLYCLVCMIKDRIARRRVMRFLITLVLAGILMTTGVLAAYGPIVFTRVLHALSFTTSSGTGEGVLPNLLGSISELSRSSFLPGDLRAVFTCYEPGKAPSIVCGVGGVMTFCLSLAGLIFLIRSAFPGLSGSRRKQSDQAADRYPVSASYDYDRYDLLYLCVLGTWFAAGLFLTGFGVRFMEHLSIPVGLLAAAAVGRIFSHAFSGYRTVTAVVLFAAAVVPCVYGAFRTCAGIRPSASDASAKAMRYIRENADDPDAVIASWWDMGYFYESESGHPCLWDGGTQNAARGVVVSQALTADDLDVSRRLLLMLASSGNAAAELLMEHMDAGTAFEALREAVVMEEADALKQLKDWYGLDAQQAGEAWKLLRPAEPKETYLVLTYTMTRQIGWYEYYANWDFTGRQEKPSSTLYAYTPDGTPVFRSEAGQAYLDEVRSKEMIWRLFFDAEQTSCFTPVFEWHDGLEHVRVWRVEP